METEKEHFVIIGWDKNTGRAYAHSQTLYEILDFSAIQAIKQTLENTMGHVRDFAIVPYKLAISIRIAESSVAYDENSGAITAITH